MLKDMHLSDELLQELTIDLRPFMEKLIYAFAIGRGRDTHAPSGIRIIFKCCLLLSLLSLIT